MNEFITVYSAEVMRRFRSRIFWIGLIFGLLGIAAMMKLPVLLSDAMEQLGHSIVLGGDPQIVSRARPLLQKDFAVAGTLPAGHTPTGADLTRFKASAIVVLKQHGTQLSADVYAKDPTMFSTSALKRSLLPLNLQLATQLNATQAQSVLTIPVQIRTLASKFGSADAAGSARGIAYILLVFLYVLILLNSQLILTSVAEEKTSRIAELLVASVEPSALLAGKIASSATLALVQMASWLALAAILGLHNTPADAATSPDNSLPLSLTGISTMDVVGFIVFFILGYLQMATLFAAVGSMINRTEDLGSLSGPLFIPVIGAFFIAMMALGIPDAKLVFVTSFIPIVSPFVMFARVVVSDVPAWQIVVSIVLNVVAIWLIAKAAGKIYRIGMLLYGRPPKFSQIFAVLRS
ncbi:MAG: ABC transporter permease [Candidatus Eremiobacteraeota bacterium]|nr:ABC transporter permease [Candidatus Eremiobacteraeota bacterium]